MDISKRVIKIVEEQLDTKVSDVNNHIADDLGADSLDIIELQMAIEEEFEVELADEVMEAATTVQAVIDLVTQVQCNNAA